MSKLYKHPFDELKRKKQAELSAFTIETTPLVEKLLREFADLAIVDARHLFQIQIIFQIYRDIWVQGKTTLNLTRTHDMPRLMELRFENPITEQRSMFPWFDRDWYRSNYYIFNPMRDYVGLGDGGVRFYLDQRGFFYFCHVLIRKYDDTHLNFYRGVIDKTILSETLATDYAKSCFGKRDLDVSVFLQELSAVLAQYIPDDADYLAL